ncbi:DUF1631 domain-containing protein [Marinobacter koreensis]|uniref:DUF1631 domain-containing protein n=1 Tax=Marinobacter koreensis TaxID=335974 RepID=A0ABW0RGP4_9GAMM|nr:DUF1631 domain-containing protein [Marinobacter koreensis]MCK7548095.1 DUF1631 domain-containing protein [Marinobacter koreensis]
MAQDNKVVSFSGGNPSSGSGLPTALVRLRDASGHSMKAMLADFFDGADDSLFELADRAASNVDQNAYFDAMRELRMHRKAMMLSMLQYVSRAFNDIGRFRSRPSGRSLDDIDSEGLSLLDHADMEQKVAIDNMVNKFRNRHLDAILMLKARVSHLVPNVDLSDSQMPLSPEVICGAIAEACSDLDIDIRAKLVVLKLFDRLLADQLGPFYQNANKALATEGVLPDLKRPPATSSQSRRTGRAAESGVAGDGGPEQGSAPGGATFSELTALLRQGGVPSGNAGAGTGTSFLDTNRLVDRLSSIQAQPGNWQPGEVVSLNTQLQSVLRGDSGQTLQVEQVDSDVINLVSMLFDFILEDRQLHPVMKALIGRLQIPVLKVALSDRNFFNRGGHPVRKLLNELALSAMGWSEKREGQRDPLKEKIEAVVTRVLDDFTDDVSLFEDLLEDFSRFTDLDRRRRELIEQRLRDAEEGRARQEKASEAADGVIQPLLENRDVPESVVSLLKDPWNRYLQWLYLREGEGADRWNTGVALTERLVWSVDPNPVGPSTRSELLRAIPSIVDDLRAALQEISWDPFATDSAIRDLELAHVDVFQRLVTAAPREETVEPPASKDPVETPAPDLSGTVEPEARHAIEPAPIPEQASDSETAGMATPPVEEAQTTAESPAVGAAPEWLERADSLRVGSWIELTRDGNKVRCKLAAFIKATGKYIFVNRSGAKVAEYLREELAASMEAGEIGMLDDGLIFDRALESIIDNLRSSRKD